MRRSSIYLLTAAVVAWGALAAGGQAQETLSQRVAVAMEDFRKASPAIVGISAVDLRTEETLLDVNAAAPLSPASNQKLLTSAFALARLGADFRFTTTVATLGRDLVLTGDGDPTLGDPVIAAGVGKAVTDELDRWAAAVRTACGGTVGDLVLCVSWPRGAMRHEDWPRDQWRRWYAAPVASLNFNNNCLDVTFSVADKQATVNVVPASRYIRVDNRVRVGRRDVWSGRTSENDSVLTLSGTVSRSSGEAINVAVDDPPLLLGRVFAERLAQAGVTITGQIRAVPAASVDRTAAKTITETTTPLAAVLARANKRSLNMAAECLLLRAGDGSWPGSSTLLARTLLKTYGVDTTGLIVRDGGGLSRKNRVSPATITGLLSAMAKRQDAKVFLDSLPISGVDGTMQNRLDEAPYRGRILGKTGYIAGVSALSGYVLDERSEPAIAFSILINDSSSAWRAKDFQDAVCRMLVNSLQPALTTTSVP